MRKIFNSTLLLCIMLLTGLASCKKYDDGPALSLRKKETRLCQTWRTQSYSEDGVDKTSDWNSYYNNASMTFGKDGNYKLYYKILGVADYNESGLWSLAVEKTVIIFNKQEPVVDSWDWKIKRLTMEELWVEDVLSNGKIAILKMIPL